MDEGSLDAAGRTSVLLVSPVRFHRDGLSNFLSGQPQFRVVAAVRDAAAAHEVLASFPADVVLVDVTAPGGSDVLRTLAAEGALRLVVLGIRESEEEVLACAEAGIAGYVSRDDSLAALTDTIDSVVRGEFSCPPHITASLVRRLTVLARQTVPVAGVPRLTNRELEIIALVDQGLSNREIAGRLCITTATVKNHVHNALEKLGARRRGEAAAIVRSGQAAD